MVILQFSLKINFHMCKIRNKVSNIIIYIYIQDGQFTFNKKVVRTFMVIKKKKKIVIFITK